MRPARNRVVAAIRTPARLARRAAFEAAGSARYSRPALFDMDHKLAAHLPAGPGLFVEAGANDGYDQSNTYYLERIRGWRGLLVEPLPAQAAACRRRRRASIVVQAALVSATHESPEVVINDASLMSTVEGASVAHDHGDRGSAALRVPALTLSAALDAADLPHVDLLSLDVEGFEEAVLDGLDFSRHAPRLALIEILDAPRRRAGIEARLGSRYELVDRLSPHDYLYRDVGGAG